MIRMSLAEAAEVMQGQLALPGQEPPVSSPAAVAASATHIAAAATTAAAPPATESIDPAAPTATAFAGVSTDSRSVVPGQLFFALEGERFDGHEFLQQAAQSGAAALVVRADHAGAKTFADRTNHAVPIIYVAQPLTALQQIARHWRLTLSTKVIGVTGSNGKTTVKEMLASILATAGPTFATRGNLNNHIGVPLMLCEVDPQHAFAVIEMGTSGPGEIAMLTRMACPDVTLVNNCGAAHLERLGSVAGVAREKSAIHEGLRADGAAVINLDDAFAEVCRAAAGTHKKLGFSAQGESDADVRALACTPTNDGLGTRLTFSIGGYEATTTLPLPGAHNVANALAAAACATAAGLSPEQIAEGLGATVPTAGRLEVLRGHAGSRVIHDAYNANPDSLRAGLETLRTLPGEHWLVLGDMRELGPGEAEAHRAAGTLAETAGIARLFTFGELAKLACAAFSGPCESFTEHAALTEHLRAMLGPDIVLLVKGSRSNRLERVVAPLTCEAERP